MQQKERWAVRVFEPGFQNVHPKAVDRIDEPASNALGQVFLQALGRLAGH
jgi:hypothetical protein